MKPEKHIWVSVTERLPKEEVFEVLVRVNEPFFGKTSPRCIVGYYSHENSQWRCDLTSREIHNVTHWQYLPKVDF